MSLTPEYLNIDFDTLVSRLRDELKKSSVFRDHTYRGSNISIILELMAYIGELTAFYTNKLAKNSYFDTVEIYENAHRLASWLGYHPMGYRSSNATVSVTASPVASNIEIGDTLVVYAWKEATTTESFEGESIKFSTTKNQTYDVDELPFVFDVTIKQGTVETYTGYTGEDLIDNELLLNLSNYCYDDDLDDDDPSIAVYVNDEEWARVDDFYDVLSGLYDDDNVYRFEYDKYRRHKIIFSSARNVPENTDSIEIKVIETFGENGNVGSGTITTPQTNFLYNYTKGTWIDNTSLTLSNSAASIGGSSPETIDEIKDMAPRTANTQFRNVTKSDYITYLERRSDVDAAGVWGEQEIAPSGSVQEFNKVYITVIPNEWDNQTINTSGGDFLIPHSWNNTYKNNLSEYLELRKMLCAYEEYVLPELVYFYYDIGLKLKRTYSFANVREDIKEKLEYYFSTKNREFNETIYFTDIINFILDTTKVSSSNDFDQVKGIQNIIMRDINSNYTIYEPNYNNNFPQYVEEDDVYEGKNKIRNITLGYNQFPVIAVSLCNFTEEL